MDINSKWFKIVDKLWFNGLSLVIFVVLVTIFFYNYEYIYFTSLFWAQGNEDKASSFAAMLSVSIAVWLSFSASFFRDKIDDAKSKHKRKEKETFEKKPRKR